MHFLSIDELRSFLSVSTGYGRISPCTCAYALTNAFSKKAENHAHAGALHFAYYNFVKIHQTLKLTPAMAAGVTDRL
jgi:hypothetical protein